MNWSTGKISTFDYDEGVGVIESTDTPGGCWFHYVQWPLPGDVALGARVSFAWNEASQDGLHYASFGDLVIEH